MDDHPLVLTGDAFVSVVEKKNEKKYSQSEDVRFYNRRVIPQEEKGENSFNDFPTFRLYVNGFDELIHNGYYTPYTAAGSVPAGVLLIAFSFPIYF